MLVGSRGLRGPSLLYLIIPALLIWVFYQNQLITLPFESGDDTNGMSSPSDAVEVLPPASDSSVPFSVEKSHNEVFSVSTPDKKYFEIVFGEYEAINPNIVPHPTLNDTWIIVAQKRHSGGALHVFHVELVCNAIFQDNTLACVESPLILPIAATRGDNCVGDVAYFGFSVGPHDARVFYGPHNPYVIYGSNSAFSCFGQWMLDFRLLTDWGREKSNPNEFWKATELQRPAPYGTIEKNWFVFWDSDGKMYAHYDVAPRRVFAQLEFDGSTGQDLAPLAAPNDEKCLATYLPKVAPKQESIHQATNSLAITLCKRADTSCVPSNENTFVFTIFQYKKFYEFHSLYEPYVMLFKDSAPFEIYGISQKPIWIHGRGGPGKGRRPVPLAPGDKTPWTQTEMFYITSFSWKNQGQKYHGYLDDEMFLAFGIEDRRTAGIDIVAGDLLKDLGLCGPLLV